ncbi:MAG: hypothetical protein JXX28_13870 [Deltaproteobacteria bacterium]|nr:hypothetical protein [Deltaproteobacteria bacterium]
MVALRVVMPGSIRDIEEVLPLLYGRSWSYGKVLHRAEERAAAQLAQVDLSGIDSIALDEVFSQGRPVLAGIDLDTQYLFQLEVHDHRSGETWAGSIRTLRDDQGLHPDRVTKDAGTGLGAGVRACWPGVDELDDLFHAVYKMEPLVRTPSARAKVADPMGERRFLSRRATDEPAYWERQRSGGTYYEGLKMGREAYRLEQAAYRAMNQVEELLHKSAHAKTETQRRSIGQGFRRARVHMTAAIDRYDDFEALRREAQEVLELSDRGGVVEAEHDLRLGRAADPEGQLLRRLRLGGGELDEGERGGLVRRVLDPAGAGAGGDPDTARERGQRERRGRVPPPGDEAAALGDGGGCGHGLGPPHATSPGGPGPGPWGG